MIGATANRMVSRSFKNLHWDYREIEWNELKSDHIGIYLHVPFCERLCGFCPFHREVFNEERKDAYLKALKHEIQIRVPEGDVEWVYLGGGTPNLLTVNEIADVITTLREYVTTEDIAMEGKPPFFTTEYLEQMHRLEVTKISMGIESLKDETLRRVHRDRTDSHLIERVIRDAHANDIMVNGDLMVGLPSQYESDFLYDVTRLAEMEIDQISTYPFTKAPGSKIHRKITSKDIFEMIEKASNVLTDIGYVRENIWVFSTPDLAKKNETEDPKDYFGFGPSAFSKIGSSQIVNPHLDSYLELVQNDTCNGFEIVLDEGFDAWRRFAHSLYDLRITNDFVDTLPRSIRFVTALLRLAGYIDGEEVTKKGRFFVHDLTTTVIERLPYPLGDPVSRGVACMNIFF